MFKKQPLGRKIMLAMVTTVMIMGLISGLIYYFSLKNISETINETNQNMGDTTINVSSQYMSETIQKKMLEMATDKANLADDIFNDFKKMISIVAENATAIYSNPSDYKARQIDNPKMENAGKLSLQVLYSASTNPESQAIKDELGLIGNIGDTLMSINNNSKSIASVYVATESGFMVQSDYIADKKFDENGNLMPLEAKERPWYVGAKETGKVYLTNATKDAHTPQLGIMCGVPVYVNGELRGVAGGGMYLDDIQEIVETVQLGSDGDACIINSKGEVLFSTRKSGSLVPVIGGETLTTTGDAFLARIARKVTEAEKGIDIMEIDGENCYVAYAPFRTVDWSLLVILPQEQVDAPNLELQQILGERMTQASDSTKHMLNQTAVLMLIIFMMAIVLSLLNSFNLTGTITMPIKKLTEEVSKVEGDNLDFHWELDTGDETQMLAENFKSLTERMKTYIDEVQKITADRERIVAELNLAEKIQYSALPHIFPPFPDRNEFDIYASMDPAREVGGDFYDYFFIDPDHLGLVIADVSGKGIPGALFMMISKSILANNTQLGMTPAEILTQTNNAICSNNSAEMFVTVWIAILEISTGKLVAANAGHEYPMIKQPDGKFELFKDKHGLVIGAMEGVTYKEYELKLQPGTKIFVYTDGVPEATNSEKQLFGNDRLLNALNIAPESDPNTLIEIVTNSLAGFVNEEEQFDDITMLCIEYKGPQSDS